VSEILKFGGIKYIGVSGGDCQHCHLCDEVCVIDLAMDYRCSEKDLHWTKANKEVFTNDQVVIAIEQFLQYGEETFCLDNDKQLAINE